MRPPSRIWSTTPACGVTLQQALRPHGGTIALHIRWHYTVPGAVGRPHRGSRRPETATCTRSRNGSPRMAGVRRPARLGHRCRISAASSISDYGDIDYSVTTPANFIVAGSGALQNPEAVLSPLQRDRLALAARSSRDGDDTYTGGGERRCAAPGAIRHPDLALPHAQHTRCSRSPHPPPSSGMRRTSACPTSAAGRVSRCRCIRLEAAQDGRWARSSEYVRNAIEYFSSRWFAYPWPDAINVAGHGANMEYPGIVFDGIADAGKKLFWVTTHEIGHGWFPMVVGSNERRAAFMDEGFNTFIDTYASDDFNHGEFAPKRDSEYAPGGGNPVDEIVPLLLRPDAPTILDEADQVPYRWTHTVQYFKAALGLRLLREQILGPQRFDAAFRRYIALWAYKHPSPSDFFRLMDSEGGEDLSWFWRGWFANNWPLDLGVAAIDAQGGAVTLVSKGGLVMPATLQVNYADGSSRRGAPTGRDLAAGTRGDRERRRAGAHRRRRARSRPCAAGRRPVQQHAQPADPAGLGHPRPGALTMQSSIIGTILPVLNVSLDPGRGAAVGNRRAVLEEPERQPAHRHRRRRRRGLPRGGEALARRRRTVHDRIHGRGRSRLRGAGREDPRPHRGTRGAARALLSRAPARLPVRLGGHHAVGGAAALAWVRASSAATASCCSRSQGRAGSGSNSAGRS